MVCSILTSTVNIENLDGIKARPPGLDQFSISLKLDPLGFHGHKIKEIKLKS